MLADIVLVILNISVSKRQHAERMKSETSIVRPITRYQIDWIFHFIYQIEYKIFRYFNFFLLNFVDIFYKYKSNIKLFENLLNNFF